MRGDLSETSAADACRSLAGESATGALVVLGADGDGRIVFDEGRVVAARSPIQGARLGDRLVGAGYLDEDALTAALEQQAAAPGGTRLGALLVDSGAVPRDAVRIFVQEQILDAMFELLRWRFGSFAFTPGGAESVTEVPIALSVDELLVEVSRRQSEWTELSTVIPHLEAVPSFRQGATSAAASLEPDEFAVLASIDGDRSIRTLATDLGYGEFELARIVYGLTLLGIVEIELPEDEIGAALDDAFSGSHGGHEAALPVDASDAAAAAAETAAEVESEPDAGPDSDAADLEDPYAWAEAAAEEPEPAAEPEPATEPEPAAEPAAEPEPAAQPVARLPSSGWVDPPPPTPLDDRGLTVEAELPAPRDVFAELRGLEGAAPATSAPEAEPAAPAYAAEPEADDAAPAAQPNSAADVSEFLRELSRLALEDEPQSRPPTKPKPSDTSGDDSTRKRRGLFGWGG